ncbi:MAG: OmpA family protein [Flavobacterium sp.]|jgi:outer membrane protein OmpA-like peptidoglycan-associated protein
MRQLLPHTYSLLALLLLGNLSVQAQQKSVVQKADKQYEKLAYVDAIKTYEKLAEKGYKSEELFQKLGNAYYFNAQLNKANVYYAQLFAGYPNQDNEYRYRYAQTLKSVGDYTQSDALMAQFAKNSSADLRSKQFENSKDYLAQIKENSGRYELTHLKINSPYSDYGSTVSNSTLVFASSRDTGSVFQRKHKWTNESFTCLYGSKIEGDACLDALKFATEINSKFHESSAVFSKDGQTMYFTRNNFNKGKKGKDANRMTLLKIYRAQMVNGSWKNVTELPFNSNDFNTAHPALNPNETILYFASDRPGGFGKSDLWQVEILADGNFGTPVNLGNNINTEGRETFPFVSKANELYFATDGYTGLGGLDIYQTELADSNWKKPQNIGSPANTSADDFGFYIDSDTQKGFLTSNREGGKGNDDIYGLLETKKMNCTQTIKAAIVDKDSKKSIGQGNITVLDDQFQVVQNLSPNADGTIDIKGISCDKNYFIRLVSPDYQTKEIGLVKSTDVPAVYEMELNQKPIAKGDDLAKLIGIKMVYFDLDKWNIRPDAAYELEKIASILEENPTLKIDVRAHTDSRQTAAYNAKLSERRAQSIMAWLVQRGIATNRLSGRGYGESQLTNRCSDGVSCSDDEHQANRRSEFVVE